MIFEFLIEFSHYFINVFPPDMPLRTSMESMFLAHRSFSWQNLLAHQAGEYNFCKLPMHTSHTGGDLAFLHQNIWLSTLSITSCDAFPKWARITSGSFFFLHPAALLASSALGLFCQCQSFLPHLWPCRLACFRGSVPQVQWGECTVHFRALKQMYGIVHIIIAQGAIWIVCLAYAVQVLL